MFKTHEVFDPVDDRQRPIRLELPSAMARYSIWTVPYLPDISRLEPTILRKRLGVELWSLEVSLEHIWASQPNFASWRST